MEQPVFLFIDFKKYAERIDKSFIKFSNMTQDKTVGDIEDELRGVLLSCAATKEAAKVLLSMCATRRVKLGMASKDPQELANEFLEMARGHSTDNAHNS